MPQTNKPDVLVVGLGAMGAATLTQLAARGVSVVGIDQFSPPHAFGSTHGETRITREAVGEGADFVPLVRRSHQIWREIETRTGQSLFDACGGLILSRRGEASHMHGESDFFGTTVNLARQFNIPHDVLDAPTVRARFPQFQLIGDECAYFEPGAGYLKPEACIDAELGLAERDGATIERNARVHSITRVGGTTCVSTDRGDYFPGNIVLALGAWLPQWLARDGALAAFPTFEATRQVLHWFNPERAEDYAPSRFPIFIWHWGGGPADVFYGFPDIGTGVKLATEQSNQVTTPETVSREVSQSEQAEFHTRHVASRLADLPLSNARAKTCLYTSTKNARFTIDWLQTPDGGRDPRNIVLVSACSGHGFKHSAAIGEGVARMIVERSTPPTLKPFSLAGA